MKKRLSLVVLAVLVIAACLTVFAACNNNNVDAYMLLTLKETLDDTKIGPVTNADFQVPATVSAIDIDENEITVDIVWTVESGGSAVTVGEKSQDGKTVTIKVTRGSSEVVYMLKGKLADANGNAYKDENGAELVSSFGCRVEASGNQGGQTPSGDKGTQNNPYTVAEALAIINGLTGEFSSQAVYVKGVVTGTVKLSTQTANTYNFDLADSASSSDKLIIWWALSENKAPAVGNNAVIYGYLQKFTNASGTKAEMNSNAGVTLTVTSLDGSGSSGGNQGGNQGGNSGGNQGGSDVEGATATISVIGTSTMTVKTAAQNVFEQNGVKITNDKASSTNNCIAVSNEAYASRFYAGSTIKIEYANMTKIVITLDDGNYNGKTYVAGFDGMDVSGATITRDGATVTIVFDSPVSVFQTTGLASQVRIYSFAIFC